MGMFDDPFGSFAAGCESFGRGVLNLGAGPISWISMAATGNGMGDVAYDGMGDAANANAQRVSDRAIRGELLRAGLDPAQPPANQAQRDAHIRAYNAGSRALDAHLDPWGIPSTFNNTYNRIANAFTLPDLMPWLIGAGALGGGYCLLDACTGGSQAPAPAPASRVRRSRQSAS